MVNTKRERFPANIPAQVAGGVIADITTGREVKIQPPTNAVVKKFKNSIISDTQC
jgi:hypothetical protein